MNPITPYLKPSFTRHSPAWHWCLLLFMTFFLTVSLSVYGAGDIATANTLQVLIPWLTGLRLSLLFILIAGWPTWVNRYARWAKLHAGQRYVLKAYRWRLALMIVVIEVVLVQNIVQKIISLVIS